MSGIGALLNTSLNIHGDPLATTLEQLKHTVVNSMLKYVLVNDELLIVKKIIGQFVYMAQTVLGVELYKRIKHYGFKEIYVTWCQGMDSQLLILLRWNQYLQFTKTH